MRFLVRVAIGGGFVSALAAAVFWGSDAIGGSNDSAIIVARLLGL